MFSASAAEHNSDCLANWCLIDAFILVLSGCSWPCVTTVFQLTY